jgi:membrane carboxypeptidase/penicillin-binding protein PbpC
VTNPPDGATYMIDPTLRSDFQALRLRATTTATWLVDGRRAAEEWPLHAGKHTITAVAQNGQHDSVRITVR